MVRIRTITTDTRMQRNIPEKFSQPGCVPLFYSDPDETPEERVCSVVNLLTSLAGGKSVTFHFEASPSTDGKSVWLGALDPTDDDFRPLALGHGIHEMMHVTDTRPADIRKCSAGSMERALFNVLEDVRVDTLGMHRYPGYLPWREALMDALRARGTLKCALSPTQCGAADVFAIWLHTELLADIGASWARAFAPLWEQALSQHLSRSTADECLTVARKIHKATASAQSVRIVQELCALLRNKMHAASEDAAPCEAPGPSKTAGGGRDSAFLQQVQNELGKSAISQSERLENVAALIGAPLYEHAAGKGRSSSRTRFAGAGTAKAPAEAHLWPDDTDNPMILNDAREYSRIFQDVRERIAVMRDELEQRLRRPACDDCEPAGEGERFTELHLTELIDRPTEPRLFEKSADTTNVDASVCILLDRSGSMGIRSMTLAKAAVLGLVLALRSVKNCSVQAACFPAPLRGKVAIVAQPDESDQTLIERFAKIGAYGSTPVQEAVEWAGHRLDESQSRDKFLLIVTDGCFPSSFSGKIENNLNERGIELGLVSLDYDDPICRNQVNIKSSEDFEEAVRTVFERSSLCASLLA